MSWDKGFNFRASSGYVTDGANETYVLHTDAYPVTRNAVTFGWNTAPIDSRDRNSANDRRLAGMNFTHNAIDFQVDLPATGDYTIRLAMGDDAAGWGSGTQKCIFKDNTTTLATMGPTDVTTANWRDAVGTQYNNASWPGSNSSITGTFATTTFIATVGNALDYSVMAHLFLSQVAAAAASLIFRPNRMQHMLVR